MRGVPCRGQGERSRGRYLLCGTFAVGKYLWSHLFRKGEGAFTRRGEGGGAGRAVLMGFRNDVVIRRRSEEAWRGINAIGGGRARRETAARKKHETGGFTSGAYRGHAYCCAPTGLDVMGVKLSSHCVFLLALKGCGWRNTLLLRADFHIAVTTESQKAVFPEETPPPLALKCTCRPAHC